MGESLKQMLMCTQGCSLTQPRLTGEPDRPCSGGTGDPLARYQTDVHTSEWQSHLQNLYHEPKSPREQLWVKITHFYWKKGGGGTDAGWGRLSSPIHTLQWAALKPPHQLCSSPPASRAPAAAPGAAQIGGTLLFPSPAPFTGAYVLDSWPGCFQGVSILLTWSFHFYLQSSHEAGYQVKIHKKEEKASTVA